MTFGPPSTEDPHPFPRCELGKTNVRCEECGGPTRCARAPKVGVALCPACFRVHIERPLGSRKPGKPWRPDAGPEAGSGRRGASGVANDT